MTENKCDFPYGDKFAKGDKIVSRTSGDMGVFDKIDKKGYVHFKQYVGGMFHDMKNVKEYTLQSNYLKLYELCSEEDEREFEKLISNGRS